jgi:hypothetical protein
MPEDFDTSGLDDIQEIPHEFVIELHHLVTANHAFVLQAINADEDVELAQHYSDDDEVQRSIERDLQYFYETLRRAANNIAAVALVTRVQHWMNKFADRIRVEPDRGLVRAFRVLTAKVGAGPVPVEFFEKLVTVCDSVIHGDGQSTWEHPPGTTRTVAQEYVNPYDETQISEDQLKDAVAKSTEQVEWFDTRLEEWRAAQQRPRAAQE